MERQKKPMIRSGPRQGKTSSAIIHFAMWRQQQQEVISIKLRKEEHFPLYSSFCAFYARRPRMHNFLPLYSGHTSDESSFFANLRKPFPRCAGRASEPIGSAAGKGAGPSHISRTRVTRRRRRGGGGGKLDDVQLTRTFSRALPFKCADKRRLQWHTAIANSFSRLNFSGAGKGEVSPFRFPFECFRRQSRRPAAAIAPRGRLGLARAVSREPRRRRQRQSSCQIRKEE